jgi:hypothetical protein
VRRGGTPILKIRPLFIAERPVIPTFKLFDRRLPVSGVFPPFFPGAVLRPAHYLRVTIAFERPFWRERVKGAYFMSDAFGGCCIYDEGGRHSQVRSLSHLSLHPKCRTESLADGDES